MKVYVAGATVDVDRVRDVQALARSIGAEITFDWTGPEGEVRADWSGAPDRARELSTRERLAVLSAHVMVLCAPPPNRGLGCYLEVGMALGAGRPVIVYGPAPRESVFWYLPCVRRADDQVTLVALLLRARDALTTGGA